MARRTSRRSRSSKQLSLPGFEGVEGKVLVPAGTYLVKVASVETKEGNTADYFAWKLTIAEGKYEGKPLYYNTSLAEQALWNLKGFLEALGVETPDEASDLDIDDLVDLELNVEVEHEKYDGKKQAKIVDFWSADGEKPSDEEEDDEKPARGKKRSAKDEDEEEKPTRRRGRPFSKNKDDDNDGEEKPAARKGKASKKKTAEIGQDEIADMDEKELEDLVEEHNLDVDLSKFRTVGKMRSAVIDAADEAGILAAE